MAEPTRIRVGVDPAYDVVVGVGLRGELAAVVADAERVLVIHAAQLRELADDVAAELARAGRLVVSHPVPDGEAAKTAAVAVECWDACARAGVTRSDAVVAVGGGATTDLAGFVAATWLRGVRVVHVPTTLLGMVDAAVGGKTAIDVPAGKNLVGAFHQPAGVVCDLTTLESLPRKELASGLAEVVKAGFIADPRILDIVEADPAAALDPCSPHLRELVERSIRVKGAVVAADPTEHGGREALNYGHTLGHAIERHENYRWRHGEAVSVGLCFAAALSRLAGRIDATLVRRHEGVLQSLGLPVRYPAGAWPDLLDTMRLDKKARGAVLRFVVLDALGKPAILADPSLDLLAAAYSEVSA